jgi:hypothetical protein
MEQNMFKRWRNWKGIQILYTCLKTLGKASSYNLSFAKITKCFYNLILPLRFPTFFWILSFLTFSELPSLGFRLKCPKCVPLQLLTFKFEVIIAKLQVSWQIALNCIKVVTLKSKPPFSLICAFFQVGKNH